jgi:selenocysteine lyase/cysteine desulfurase
MRRITLHTPASRELSAGIVCFEVAGMPPDQIVAELRRRGIVASVTPYRTQYARMAPGVLNSPAEIETVLKEIHALST